MGIQASRRATDKSANATRPGHEKQLRNSTQFKELLSWFVPEGALFDEREFHGNVKWVAEQVVIQTLIWFWQEAKNVTDAFEQTREICDDLKLTRSLITYTSFMNALTRYSDLFRDRLQTQFQMLAEEVGGDRLFRTRGWVLIGFDGSRATTARTVSNERAFCAPNYGKGKRAKYGKKKSKGQRRQRNKENPPQPQAPQAWITMMWHMGMRLPWTWRLGPSNSSERDHVKDILWNEEFPEKTLFCGDAGFTGYPLWDAIINTAKRDFLIRVGGNVSLLSEQADIKRLGGGRVLCWPKGRMNSGSPPLRLRLVRVKVGKTRMWILTSVLSPRKLSKRDIAKIYKMRWGIEVEFRGLKQTIDKHKLRCRTSPRVLAELDWSIRGMAVAELLALRAQTTVGVDGTEADETQFSTPRNRSLAKTMKALRRFMRRLHKYDNLSSALATALVQEYNNTTDKRARYRRKNPDRKKLGEPKVRKLNAKQIKLLKTQRAAA